MFPLRNSAPLRETSSRWGVPGSARGEVPGSPHTVRGWMECVWGVPGSARATLTPVWRKQLPVYPIASVPSRGLSATRAHAATC